MNSNVAYIAMSTGVWFANPRVDGSGLISSAYHGRLKGSRTG